MASSTTTSSSSSLRLEGKTALVTGGAAGIGESIVKLFHRHGAKVFIVDVQDEAGRRLRDSLGGEAAGAYYFHCDVTVEDEVRAAVDAAVAATGGLDVMVNNAGMGGSTVYSIVDTDLAEFDRVMALNVRGVYAGTKHAARVMIPRRRGSIVSTASVASVVGGIAPHAYTASKHAVVGLTRSAAAELGKHGIRVNCVSPYGVPTALAMPHLAGGAPAEGAREAFLEAMRNIGNLAGVDLTAEDVAEAVAFLAGDEARFVSGQNLVVDGGFTSVNHSLGTFK